MSGIFSSVMKATLDRLSSPSNPNQVKSVNPSELAPIPTVDREDSMVLYGPRSVQRNAPPTFEIVVNADRYSYSLFRSTEKSECITRFSSLKSVIPVILGIDPGLSTCQYLQTISDLVRLNPGYSPLHVAVELDLKQVLTHESLSTESHLNAADELGRTPLMIAIKAQNLYAIRYLMGKIVSFSQSDSKGNNIFHYAAATKKEIVQELSTDTPDAALNKCNIEGHTPLHIACLQDMPECVQALLCAGADVNVTGSSEETPMQAAINNSSTRCVKEIIQMHPKQLHIQDIKHGGTPLHWAKSSDIIEALIEAGCSIDAKNFQGNTALHVMTHHERLDCVVALISFGANVNSQDNSGNTALHIACKNQNTTIVRALLVFDADTYIKNNACQLPWDIAVKPETGIMSVIALKDPKEVLYSLFAVGAAGSEAANRFDFHKQQAKSSPSHKRTRAFLDDFIANAARVDKTNHDGKDGNKGRLLSLDGGGIKGLVLTRMLRSMEQLWGVPIIHCFDWLSGTSTGGILALALASGKSVTESQAIYMKLKDKVFVDTKPYNSQNFDKFLAHYFGSLKMYDIKSPKVIVTATVADRLPPDLHLFRTYKSPQEIIGIPDCVSSELPSPVGCHPSDQLVWKAARASGAAPSFFRPSGNFVDGALVSNNPSLDILTEVAEYNCAQKAAGREDLVVKPRVLVSLGTGIPPIKKTTIVDIFRPDSAGDTLKLFLNWDSMGKLMLKSVLDSDGRVVDQARSWCMSLGIPYFRFSPFMSEDTELDEKDDKVLVDLMWNTMAYILTKKDELMQLRDILCN